MACLELDFEDFVVDMSAVDWEKWNSKRVHVRRDESTTWFLPLPRQFCQPQSRLLQLPTELICLIAENILYAALSRFAQVSKACRHLARCRQFSSVRIFNRPLSCHDNLLSRLYQEARRQAEFCSDSEDAYHLRIGPYIKTLYYHTDLNGRDLEIEYPIPRRVFINRQAMRRKFLSREYAQALEELSLSIERAMPNLKDVTLDDPISLPLGLLTALKQSRPLRLCVNDFTFQGSAMDSILGDLHGLDCNRATNKLRHPGSDSGQSHQSSNT